MSLLRKEKIIVFFHSGEWKNILFNSQQLHRNAEWVQLEKTLWNELYNKDKCQMRVSRLKELKANFIQQ